MSASPLETAGPDPDGRAARRAAREAATRQLSTLLKQLHRESERTWDQLADAAHVGRNTVRNYLGEELRRRDRQTLKLLLDAMDVSPERREDVWRLHPLTLDNPVSARPSAACVVVGRVPELVEAFQERDEARLLGEVATPGTATVLTQGAGQTVVAGLGGVGKTELAAQWARRLRDRGEVEVLVWVRAATATAVVTAYADAALALGLPGVISGGQRDLAGDAGRFLGWLAGTGQRWAVVLDNLDDPAAIRGMWPPTSPTGRTVITSRRRDAALLAGRNLVDVAVFTSAAAATFLSTRLPAHLVDDAAALKGVAEDLGWLPLALGHAAAYMIERDLTCGRYRERFADRRRQLAELFPQKEGLFDDAAATVAGTWALSIDAADALAPRGVARRVLEIASVLDPAAIPLSVLLTPAARAYCAPDQDADSGSRTAPTTAESDARDALSNLVRLSLVTVSREPDGDESVSVHALVQRATVDHFDPRRRHMLACLAAWSMWQCWPEVERDARRGQMLRTSVEALVRSTGDDLWIPDRHPLLIRAGRSFRDSGFVHAAVDYWRRVYRTSERVLGADHESTLTARHEYAGTLRDGGNLPAAITELEELLRDETRVLSSDHPELITTRYNLATYRGEQGHFAEALASLEKTLPDRIRVFGADSRHTLTTRATIARFSGECGDPAAAVGEYAKVLKDRTRLLGPDDRDTLDTREGLAYWKAKSGLHRQASREFAALAADYARVLHPDAYETLKARHDAAKWLGTAGDAQAAAAALEDLVHDNLRVFGADHPETIATRGSHADWVGAAGDPQRAAALFADIVADAEQGLGATHLDTFICRGNYAHWQWQAGNINDSLHAHRRLYLDMGRELGQGHPRVIAVRKKLDAVASDWRACNLRTAKS